MKIPFYKPTIGPEEINEVVDTLKSGWLTTGPKTKQFERDFAAYVRQSQAVAVNSCTAALHLALEAIGLKAGQGVVVPTMTFAATAEVVRYFGARPVLVDCRTEDFNLDVTDAGRKVESELAAGREVVAIMPVHCGGQIGDVAGVQRLAKKYHLKVIEDAAHCCPAYYRERIPEVRSQKSAAIGRSDLCPPSSDSSAHSLAHPMGLEPFGKRRKEFAAGQEPERAERAGANESLGLGVRDPSEVSLSSSASQSCEPGPQPSAINPQPSTLNFQTWLPVGHSADISCYSFYANKTITTGEGGMACTNNAEYADRMRIMSLHGISRDAWKRFTAEGSWYYEITSPGYKYNLTDIASAIGIHQLRKAEVFHQRRTAIVQQYSQSLHEVEEIILPALQPNRIHSWHLYVIRLKLDRLNIDRAQFISELQRRGIGASVHWMPLHMHPYYRETYGYAARDLPTACSLYPEILTLPVYPDMSESDVQYVCEAIKDIVAQHRTASR